MKFLCGNCKAKYQIADAKVAGRTLRMKCRRCGHDILIQGEGQAASAPAADRVAGSTISRPPNPARAAVNRMPPLAADVAPPSALGQGFRRGLAAPPEAPPRLAAHDQWHVAINDVPVGPMSREEMGRKIAAGAVSSASLCWREGMDDWRPVEEVPELAALLARPPRGPASRPPLRQAPVGGRLGAGAPLLPEEYDDEFGEPTRVADVSQLRGGGSSMSSLPMSQPSQQVPVSPPSMAAEPSGLSPRPQMSPWALIGIGMALAMGLLGGPFIIMRLLESPAASPAQVAVAPTPPTGESPEAKPEVDTGEEQVEMVLEAEELDETPEEAKAASAKPTRNAPSSASGKSASASGRKLSAEEEALLKRMGGGGGAAPSNLGSRRESSGGGGGGGESLTAAQLRSVVTKNRPGLQRCYESALRATSSAETVKIDVSLTVGMSGTVTATGATGNGIGDLKRCIERTVKRWRFPSSSGSTKTAFPVVFQPGA